jgi:hypothetical protein
MSLECFGREPAPPSPVSALAPRRRVPEVAGYGVPDECGEPLRGSTTASPWVALAVGMRLRAGRFAAAQDLVRGGEAGTTHLEEE